MINNKSAPVLNVTITTSHIECQVLNTFTGHIIVQSSTKEKEIINLITKLCPKLEICVLKPNKYTKRQWVAMCVGIALASRLRAAGVDAIHVTYKMSHGCSFVCLKTLLLLGIRVV